MANNNNVSSFFLLILFGLAIYYLLNNEGFNSLSKLTNNIQEQFTDKDLKEDDIEDDVEGDYDEQIEKQFEEDEKQFEKQVNTPEIEYNVSQEPYVPQSVINDIAVNTNQQTDVNTNQQQMGLGIYNFQPNDESELGISGSSLNDAFALPIPNGVPSDAIDFKKQNVDNYNAKDFLPREVNDEWFETDFSLAKYQLNDDKLINTEKYIIGINTVGQSLKNASWDIRGTIPNPKVVVSPWNNSTYEPDFNLKPLC